MSMSELTRRGGYLTTVEQAERMDKKQDELMDKMMEIAMDQIKIGKPENEPAPKGDKIPSNSGDSDASAKVVSILTLTTVLF